MARPDIGVHAAARGAVAIKAEDRATMQFDVTRLAFALAAYRADRGGYPVKLADLAPQYVAKVPRDISTTPSCTTGSKAAAICSTAWASTARMTAGRATTIVKAVKTGTTWPSACRQLRRNAATSAN